MFGIFGVLGERLLHPCYDIVAYEGLVPIEAILDFRQGISSSRSYGLHVTVCIVSTEPRLEHHYT